MPDGIVAASDSTANGVIKVCLEQGISIPEELSIIGFDNINVDLPTLALTTVAVSPQLHVKKGIDLLMKIKGERIPSKEEMSVKLQPKLVERDSCLKNS